MDQNKVNSAEKPQPPRLLKTNQFDRRHKMFYRLVGLIGILLLCLGISLATKDRSRYVSTLLIILGLAFVLAACLLAILGRKTSERNARLNLEAKLLYARQKQAYEASQEAEAQTQDQSAIAYSVYFRPVHSQRISLLKKLEAEGYTSVKVMETIEDPIYGQVLWCYLDHEKAYVINGDVVSEQSIIDDLDRKYGRSPEERRSGIIYD